jgi:hypothetical protein
MDVHLLDIDLEMAEPAERVESKKSTLFGYNRIDFGMLVLCCVLMVLLVAFFIWFAVQHSK